MNFVNNWNRPITLAAGVTSVALDIPDGEYRLSLADSATEPTRQEIVGATVASGTATLTRGLEGTLDQDWPAGSTIYNAVTAGWLTSMAARVKTLEQGGGGGGGAVVSSDRPQATPTFTGQLHVWEDVASYVALASNTPEDWALFAGVDWGFGYSLHPGSPNVSYQLDRAARRIQVTAEPGTLPEGFPVTLRIPAWEGLPHGWSLEVLASGIALSLDFSGLGEMLYCLISDFETGTTASLAGAILTLRNSQPISISLNDFGVYPEGVNCGIEVRATQAPTVSFLPEFEE